MTFRLVTEGHFISSRRWTCCSSLSSADCTALYGRIGDFNYLFQLMNSLWTQNLPTKSNSSLRDDALISPFCLNIPFSSIKLRPLKTTRFPSHYLQQLVISDHSMIGIASNTSFFPPFAKSAVHIPSVTSSHLWKMHRSFHGYV